jgi:Tfp pilus assembly protein PilO
LRNNTAAARTPGDPRTLRTRFDSFRTTRRRSALGLPEALALAVAALLLLVAVLSYLFLLVPQRSRLQNLEIERADLQRLLQSTRGSISEQKGTQQNVSEILGSLDRFEVDHLGQSSSGVKTVYEELNRLIIKNNLRISGGITYTQLQEAVPGADANQTQRRPGGEETTARVVQSVFPGIGVTLTVEGTYANLRRFIRDIEADRQFVVINTVELEGVTDSNAGAVAPAPASPEGPSAAVAPTRGALVSLRLDMAAYFRRSGAGAE